jgi:hypothetical protein
MVICERGGAAGYGGAELSKLDGVTATVNFATGTARVSFGRGQRPAT